jgi:hypothetical protein
MIRCNIGDLRLGIPLYNVYLNEADEWSRRLQTALGRWASNCMNPPDDAVALAHSLAGSSGHRGLQGAVGAGAHAGTRAAALQLQSRGSADDARAFVDAADDIRRLLHQFAAGFLKEPQPAVLQPRSHSGHRGRPSLLSGRPLSATEVAEPPTGPPMSRLSRSTRPCPRSSRGPPRQKQRRSRSRPWSSLAEMAPPQASSR